MTDLDPDLLRAFIGVAETNSFTKAGLLTGASQSAVSIKIKKLEERLGNTLLARSPRSVQLTAFGARFLNDARELITLHDRVISRANGKDTPKQVLLGISDHAAGARLPEIIAKLSLELPECRWHVTVGLSGSLFSDYKSGLFNAVLVRFEDVEATGQTAFEEELVWTASNDFQWQAGSNLPLVALASSCALRQLATNALNTAGVGFEDAFVGTGVGAVQAAVSSGLGIACLDKRNVPGGCRDIGAEYQLPKLPKTRMTLYSREKAAIGSAILRAFRAA
ncbi:LysR family transcriptional regulator [Roseibium porphyridii]|uniref:LysR family transcriptional regulator n=1 Tax=Roseibium porphyridii TaxID=2866279 RepID=A0ABY8F1H1_9HYPH|nr:LysR family transcriptional regulator [Roseibium sp. KMA01]WFE89323.1 LysR family transcriptional regulator [Roseibium sp. KMA01]